MAEPDELDEIRVTVDDGRTGPPRPGTEHRQQPRWTSRLRPWVDWFGTRRLIGGALTVAAVVVGGWWLLRPADQPTEAGLPRATTPSTTVDRAVSTAPMTTLATVVVVHVAGAVAAPGVYELAPGTRVDGAVAAAGGATPDADPSMLNLAAALVDGERVYVPRVGESVPPPIAPGGGGNDGSAVPVGPVDLNRASVDELDELPGVGPATAQAIVEHREEHGPFATVDDLEAVRGIGPAKLDAIRDLVTL